jgi:hypothetical protein
VLDWNANGEKYTISLKQGTAIIRETVHDGNKIYFPQIEDSRGNVIAQFEPGLHDFETANDFISANLSELDRVGTDDAGFRRKLVSTLDTCLALLPEPSGVFHRRRLENIQHWLLRQRQNVDTRDLPQADWNNHVFEWRKENNRYFFDALPHGKVVIIEYGSNAAFGFGKAATYTVQIEDTTGVVLHDSYVATRDISAAEARLREILTDLETPFVDEVYLDYLSFTLQICHQLLPTNTDLMQFVRLQYIENYLWEVLP